MIAGWRVRALRWGVGPLLVAALATGLGVFRARAERGPFLERTSSLSEAERQAIEAVPAQSVANATWAFGPLAAVRTTIQAELVRLGDSEGPARARALIRLCLVDTNFDGQAALFNAACAADGSICDHMKEAGEREVRARFVAPGNRLSLLFAGGHPRVPGAFHGTVRD